MEEFTFCTFFFFKFKPYGQSPNVKSKQDSLSVNFLSGHAHSCFDQQSKVTFMQNEVSQANVSSRLLKEELIIVPISLKSFRSKLH